MPSESTIISTSIVENTQYDNKDFYIERNFIDHSFITDDHHMRHKRHVINRNSKNFEEISLHAANKKVILLSDYAATGKTTTFKHLSMKLKEKFPNYWISYIDIKDHLSECEENYQILPTLITILNITDEIDVELFTNLYNADKVILLFDNYSGIPQKCKEFFIKLFQNIQKSTKIQQWISTQPQDVNELTINLNQTPFKLVPFDDTRKAKIIRHILRNLNIKDNAEKVLKEIQEICRSSHTINDSHRHPLMLAMIAEFYLKNKPKSFTFYSLLNEMIHEKLKDAGSEKSKMTIWQVHQAYALQTCFKDGMKDYLTKYQRDDDDYESEQDVDPHESDFDTDSEHASDAESTDSYDYNFVSYNIDTQKFQLLQKWKEEKLNWTADEISQYGLLDIHYFNTCDEFPVFKHELLADYFVVQYAVDKIFDTDDCDDAKLSIELLLSMTKDYHKDRGNLITTLIENQKPKKLSEKIFQFAVSNQMHKVIKNEELLKKLFCCDERFLKFFRFAGNTTIFQKDYRSNWCYSDEMLKIYEKTLGDDWIRYTGYKLNDNDNYAVPNDDEIDKIFDSDFVKKTIKEKDEDTKSAKIECKKLYKLLCLVERVKFPKNDFVRIFQYRTSDVFDYSFRCRAMIEKLIEIIRRNIDKCREEFHKMLKDQIFGVNFFVTTTDPATDDYVRNVADFCNKFLKYSLNDSTLEYFRLRIFAQFCCFEIFASLHDKYQICTQDEIQKFLIAYSVPIIYTLTYNQLNYSVSRNLEAITKNIFDDKSKELRKFIENRYECKDVNSDYNGHTILSFVKKEYDREKNYKFYIHGLKIAQNVIIKTARLVGMCDDEIEML